MTADITTWRGARVQCAPHNPLPAPDSVTVSSTDRIDRIMIDLCRITDPVTLGQIAGEAMRLKQQIEHADDDPAMHQGGQF